MAYECIYRASLDLSQERVIRLDLLEIRNIGKELFRVDKVLVHIIEVTKDDISPEHELVQSLCLRIKFSITLVQV